MKKYLTFTSRALWQPQEECDDGASLTLASCRLPGLPVRATADLTSLEGCRIRAGAAGQMARLHNDYYGYDDVEYCDQADRPVLSVKWEDKNQDLCHSSPDNIVINRHGGGGGSGPVARIPKKPKKLRTLFPISKVGQH